jgi:hypothetical protein
MNCGVLKMSRIIERVPSQLHEWKEEHVSCNKCGCGNTKDLTEKPCPRPGCNGYWKKEIVQFSNISRGYTLIKCDCGEEVYCDGFTNTCECCGADYNSAGQQLAPRCFWGEETGESIADILGPSMKEDW